MNTLDLSHLDEILKEAKKDILSKDLPPYMVTMWDGKYSDYYLETFALAGCTACILYLEDSEKSHGILTHFPPGDELDNFNKIKELKEKYLANKKFKVQKGYILACSKNLGIKNLSGLISCIFPGIDIEFIKYDMSSPINELSFCPEGKTWSSSENHHYKI